MDEQSLSPRDRAQRDRQALVRVVRMVFLVMFFVVTLVFALEPLKGESSLEFQVTTGWWVTVIGATMIAALLVGVDIATPHKKLRSLVAVAFGLLAGMLATILLGSVIDLFVQLYELRPRFDQVVTAIKVLLGMAMCFLAISWVLQTSDDFRLVIPYVEFAKQLRGPKPLLLDTSALVDGRVADLASVGIVQVPVIVPRFVLEELQLLGDRGDKLQRLKSKRGLETVTRLQRIGRVDVSIDETIVPGAGVDQMLMELARIVSATIVTTDAGLARVAGVQGIGVLNLHEVANALRPTLLPGTRLSLHIARAGEQPGQGVGYTDDGSMIVVEDGGGHVGTDQHIEILSAMQTAGGRLLFARVARLDADPTDETPATRDMPTATNPAATTPPAAPAAVPAPADAAIRPASGTGGSGAAGGGGPGGGAGGGASGPLGPNVGLAGRRVPNRNPRR